MSATPLNAPLPGPLAAPRPSVVSAPGPDLVPLEEMTLSSGKVKAPAASAPTAKAAPAPRPTVVAQANTGGNTASGVVTMPVDSTPRRAVVPPAAPLPAVVPAAANPVATSRTATS
ncbi:hypothetical protein ACQV5M_22010, partial [Leptospira sp. SA-E8]|uniref:hypothetical protein n=1 Tax=Leptospira sp. SA-E8 TaxID=3422259 RepID=UPI003EBA3E07